MRAGGGRSSRIYLSPPHVGAEERQLLLDAFDSNWIAPLGPHVDAFEEEMGEYVGVSHALALSSGTAALHLALAVLDIGPGDEVVVSDFTFAASANAVVYTGARPVFIDSERETWNMDPDLLAEELEERSRIGKLPRAVIVVDLYGQCADYERIESTCASYGVPLIEDAAEALGATYKGRKAGSFGAMSVLSFNGNKIITTSGGGMLLSDNKRWIDRARKLSTQAREPAVHYEHHEIGYNYRLSNLLAAVGRAQLRALPERITRRREINGKYRERLASFEGVKVVPGAQAITGNCWLTCLVIDPRVRRNNPSALVRSLEEANIEARPTWKPMHMQPVFTGHRCRGGSVSEEVFSRGLCLPSGSALSAEEQDIVIERLIAALGESEA